MYHGSKGGIDGPIEPISRVRCDFGKGFYMGTDCMQAKSLVSGDDMPYYYTLKFHLSDIPREKILLLEGKQWLNTVLACRHADPEFDRLQIAKQALHKLDRYDVIIGPIADDKMREAMAAFIDNALTDKGLERCLSNVDFGLQVVAKTRNACKKIEIIEEKRLTTLELQNAIEFSAMKREECRNIVDDAKREFDGVGKTFYGYIKAERIREQNLHER